MARTGRQGVLNASMWVAGHVREMSGRRELLRACGRGQGRGAMCRRKEARRAVTGRAGRGRGWTAGVRAEALASARSCSTA
jgi:hypothetical protein